MAVCPDCRREWQIGEWPYCPHGPARERIPFRPYWEDNFGMEPVLIDSVRKLDMEMKARGLEPIPKEHLDDINERRICKGMPPLRK